MDPPPAQVLLLWLLLCHQSESQQQKNIDGYFAAADSRPLEMH
jgi:hypothetical protein